MDDIEKGYNHQENHRNYKTEDMGDLETLKETIRKIRERGFGSFIESIPGYADAFDLEKHKAGENSTRCLCCMDERISNGLHSAGSGILLSEKEFAALSEKAKPDSISSHQGCGAAKIFAKSDGGKKFATDRGLSLDDPDGIAKTWAIEMAEKLGIPYMYFEPQEQKHSAVACYYDGTGMFNNSNGWPQGFVVGRRYMNQKSSLVEVKVAKDIMWGDHGFGPEFFTKENPFLLVAIGNTQEEVDILKKELATLLFEDSVAIEGFVSPKLESKTK